MKKKTLDLVYLAVAEHKRSRNKCQTVKICVFFYKLSVAEETLH